MTSGQAGVRWIPARPSIYTLEYSDPSRASGQRINRIDDVGILRIKDEDPVWRVGLYPLPTSIHALECNPNVVTGSIDRRGIVRIDRERLNRSPFRADVSPWICLRASHGSSDKDEQRGF